MIDVTDPITWKLMGDALKGFRDAVGLVKDAKGLLPAGPQQEAVTKSLEHAERMAQIAEAQMAQSLGFRLHDCAWPPPMMFAVQTPHGEERRCQKCGFTTGENKSFEPLLPPNSGWMA